MKDNFRGWTSVYAFTLRQSTKGIGFKLVTISVALLIMASLVLMNILIAKPTNEKKLEASPIKEVFVLDNSGLQPANFGEMLPQLAGEQFGHIHFVSVSDKSTDEIVKSAAANSSETVAVVISAQASGFELKALIPENSKIRKNDAEALLGPMSAAFSSSKRMQAGLSAEQLGALLKPVVVSYSEIGKNTSEITKAIKMLAPMLFSFMLYFMLLLYGQTVSRSVSTEKTSKLMEVLLTSVHPYALIAGKVLAVTSMALGQFVTWILAAVAGLYGGNAIAQSMYPQYQNSVIMIINYLKDNIGQTALTLPAIALAIVFFCIGFLFYCVIAALAGSMVSKPEDVATTQAIFQLPIIASWMASYFAPIIGNDVLLTAIRYIPLTSPFTVPVDLITGSMGLIEGLISMALLLAFSLLTTILSARIYKGLVLYTGQPLSVKMLANVLKANHSA